MEKKYEIIDKIIEIEIYLYIIFMFLTKGEGIRNILLFSAFGLWLATLQYRENKYILKEPVSIVLWGFIATILLSVVFSIEPLYSLESLKEQPLKAIAIYCLLSTTLSSEARLKKFVYLTFPVLVFTVSVGYYSYWAYDMPLMKPVTTIRHAMHSRFAMDINTLLPFSFIFLLTSKKKIMKIILSITIIAAILGIILSTSRGGIAAFLTIVVIWSMYMLKKCRINVRTVFVSVLIIVVLAGITLYSSPNIGNRFRDITYDLSTLHERTDIWKPLISAVSENPIIGWGYGPDIFTRNEPFEKTPYKKAPVVHKEVFRNPHNSFLQILFHQGIIGLISYVLLLVIATGTFWRVSFKAQDLRSFILAACMSIMIGTYCVNSMLINPALTDLAVILGIGMAAKTMRMEEGKE